MSPTRIEDLSPAKRELLRRRLARQRGAATTAAAPAEHPERPARLPLSFAQQRLWLLDRLEHNKAAYNLLAAHRLEGPLDERAFGRALSQLVGRHEALRTTFPAHDGEPEQRIAEPRPLPLPIIDLAGLEVGTGQRVASSLASAAGERPFDLARGPLLRALLLRLGKNQHAFAFVFHHIVSDGWSMRILLFELFALYHALAAGGTAQDADLPRLTWQYADFALDQRRRLRGEVLAGHLQYWQKQLAGIPAALELPTDRPRPAVLSLRGAAVPMDVAPRSQEALHRLARAQGTTPFVVLLTAFAALLHRLSGQHDLVVGAPMAGRERLETENLIGCFVNTLVLRIDLRTPADTAPTFLDLLRRVGETTLDAHGHQALPFERLVEELQPERTLSHAPLFQVLFAYQRIPQRTAESAQGRSADRLLLRPLDSQRRTALFDLSLSLDEDEHGLAGVLEYSTDLFDPSRVQRWVGSFSRLLNAALATPGLGLDELPLLSAGERQQLLREWNDTAASDLTRPATLPALFAQQVQRTPEAVSLTYGFHQLSYGSLATAVTRLALHLQRRGVGPETRVGICLERGLAMVVAIFATLEAGGAYVPLDPSYPAERLRLMATDAGLHLLLTSAALASASGASVDVLLLEDNLVGRALPAIPGGQGPPYGNRPEGLAYVIYTSGSTGRPKGVMISHAAIVNRLRWMQQTYGLAPGDRVLQKTPFSFDVSLWEFFWPLLSGAELVMAEPGGHRDSAWLAREIDRRGITTVHFVPSMLTAFLEECERQPRQPGPRPCRRLRQVFASGEALPAELAKRFLANAPHTELHNLYGPTEAAVDVTSWPCSGAPGPLPIGRPIANLHIHLLANGVRPAPIGTPGELHIAGAGLARGYLRRPALTAASFVPNPFSRRPGARMYQSGDLARHRGDGAIEFLGRRDHQVKVRGFRVELAEVEAVLERHPKVRQAAALVHERTPGDPHLAAWVVIEENTASLGAPITPGNHQAMDSPQAMSSPQAMTDLLRAHLSHHLPDHMVPTFFILLPALPLSPNGKVDHRALRRLASEESTLGGLSEAPRRPSFQTPIEEILLTIWSEVLGREGISPADHFFHLGGHSLLGARVMARVRDLLAADLELRDLFAAPTLGALARRIEQARQHGTPAPPIQPRSRSTLPPMSFGQERLWFLDQLAPESATYNVPTCLRLQGPLVPDALSAALHHLVERHETLRTTFAFCDGEAVQCIADAAPQALPVVDLTALEPPVQQATLRNHTTTNARRPFDLATGPLVRCTLLSLAADDHVLLLTLHHIISDGASLDVLVHELGALYEAALSGLPAALPPLPIQYADYAIWQRAWLQGEILERRLHFWRQQLTDLGKVSSRVGELPTDRPRPPLQTFRGDQCIHRLPPPLARAAEEFARQVGVTPFMTLLAVSHLLLHRRTQASTTALGTPVANRSQRQVEGLIGFFVNTLVLRADFAGTSSFRTLVAQVRHTTLDACTHQDLPFEKLVAEIAPTRDLSHSPFFQVMFQMQTAPLGPAETFGDGLDLSILPVELGAAKFDLTLVADITTSDHDSHDSHLGDQDRHLDVAAQYNTDLFDPTSARRLLHHFGNLLAAALRDPEQPLDRLTLLAPAESQQLLAEWNDTAAPKLALPTTLSALFARQVARTPEAVALSFGEEHLSFCSLAQAATRLAQHLSRRGVGLETVVGIRCERSINLVIALLATLEAGAAFVPLDPTYPGERLAFMADDTQLAVLLTTEVLASDTDSPHQVLLLDEHGPGRSPVPFKGSAGIPSVPPTPDAANHLAYVIYTSGSTGRPKGAMNSHAALVNRLLWMQAAYGLQSCDRVLQKTPFSFDVSVWEFFWPLLCGVELVMARPGGHLDSAWMVEEIVRRRVTTLHFVPPMLAIFLEERDLPSCHSLRRVMASGEALTPELVDHFHTRLPEVALHNLYGPTEAAIEVTSWPCVGEDRPLPIGRPIANLRIHVLDSEGRTVPIGVPGELHIAGLGLARGYLRRPALTARTFVPNPFARQAGERMYRSGDLARHRPDGAIEFLGRRDHQVKVRGFRIELGEIEAALRQHPAVADAVVLVQDPGSSVGAALVAYTVMAAGNLDAGNPDADNLDSEQARAATADLLRADLGRRLPAHMVPSLFVYLPAFPRTAHGKIDRQALPKAQQARDLHRSSPRLHHKDEPRTVTEQRIAAIWCRVLAVERVGAAENFFDLGGHSLLMMRAFQLLKAAFDPPLTFPLVKVFEHPTVSTLGRFIDLQAVGTPGSPGGEENAALARAGGEQRGESRRRAQRARAAEHRRRRGR